jgi:two-component system alkaline phosphatase synthesis response regulator PhoP
MAKILVVDDEPSITKLVSAYLKPEGYEVYTAADGNAGLKAARIFKPDLIILDVMLPGLDGIELLSRLRRESDVYVIMLTARTEETDKIVGLSVGADDYVTKPFSPRELVAESRRLCGASKQGQPPAWKEACCRSSTSESMSVREKSAWMEIQSS